MPFRLFVMVLLLRLLWERDDDLGKQRASLLETTRYIATTTRIQKRCVCSQVCDVLLLGRHTCSIVTDVYWPEGPGKVYLFNSLREVIGRRIVLDFSIVWKWHGKVHRLYFRLKIYISVQFFPQVKITHEFINLWNKKWSSRSLTTGLLNGN